VAHFRDWVDLGRNTIDSLKTSDVTNLYEREWPETKKALIAEHRDSIEHERKQYRRWLRTTSAVLFGLAKRLAPHRRVIFAFSFLLFFACIFSLIAQTRHPPIWVYTEIVATFLLLTLLLSMELIDKIKFRDELELARDLQAGLIPHELPQTDQFEIAAHYDIANTVGGDIYDFVPLPDGRIAILFGDASGHGMAAGLVMAVAHAAFRTQLDVDPSPAAVISSLNRILCRTGGPRSFFACCYVVLSADGDFTITTAGHPPLLHVDTNGKIIERIGTGSYPLGIKSGLVWRYDHRTLNPGERLLFHSDGLTEARNGAGHEFGDSFVEAILGWNARAEAAAIVDTLVSELRLFTGGHAPEDDVSIAVVRRKS
jgi:serine phosphatase RsbU (regulator of sigma subunit)